MTNDDATMLVFATRYCLGRHTYAPGVCCDVLRRRWADLKPGDREVILRDIHREVDGIIDPADIDLRTWNSFLEWADDREMSAAAYAEARRRALGDRP